MLNVAFKVADEQGLPILDLTDLQALLICAGRTRGTCRCNTAMSPRRRWGRSSGRSSCSRTRAGISCSGSPRCNCRPDAADRGRAGDGEHSGGGQADVVAAPLCDVPAVAVVGTVRGTARGRESGPPVLVFFFDEAHLLFADAPKALVEKVEQVARLIRSKGVGIYFITQNPADVPDSVLGQLGTGSARVACVHGEGPQGPGEGGTDLSDNPRFATADAIRDVGTGEAVTSMLDRKGVPLMVERTLIRPPESQLGPLDPALRAAVIAGSPMGAKYAMRWIASRRRRCWPSGLKRRRRGRRRPRRRQKTG